MSAKTIITRALVVILIFSVFTSSCRKDEIQKENSFFVSKELLISLNKGYISNLIDLVSVTVPEAANMKSRVSSDINVYKVVYNSVIRGEKTRLSALVCVPATTGSYPVLSFQNGTNTLNARAPSESAFDYTYQMVEVIASMGYVVVMADYPGFGESAQLPHPYLVAEPTVRSLVDLLYTVREMDEVELPNISIDDEFYLIGYSQGGWATLQLHKSLELDFDEDFNLAGSVCGAGPYNINLLLQSMVTVPEYPMPVYIGYIINGFKAYNQFTNPVSDILNEPYSTRLGTLYNGNMSFGQINSQLTTSIPDLLTPDFLTGFSTSAKYAPVRSALAGNSVSAWHSYVPLLMTHGTSDTQVNPVATENMYAAMIQAGTSPDIIKKVVIPGADHSEGIIPSMILGFAFLQELRDSK